MHFSCQSDFLSRSTFFKNDRSEDLPNSVSEDKLIKLLRQDNKDEVDAVLHGLFFLEDGNNYSKGLHHFAMLIAAERDLLEEAGSFAKKLVEKGGSINALNAAQETALIAYARNGNTGVVKFLVEQIVENGEDLGLSNADAYTALHAAAESGSEEVVNILLGQLGSNGCALERCDNQGKTPLLLAVDKGFVGVCRLLLEAAQKFKNPSSAIHYMEHVAFRHAIEKKDLVIVKVMVEILLNVKGELFLTCHKGLNALTWTAVKGNTAMLEIFLAQLSQIKKKISSEDRYLYVALKSAAENGCAQMEAQRLGRLTLAKSSLSATVSQMRKLNALEIAVKNGHAAAVKVLIDNIYSNAKNIDEVKKNALLRSAVNKEHWAIASLLFDKYKQDFEQARNVDDLQNTFLDIFRSAATHGGFDKNVAEFTQKLMDLVKNEIKEDAVEFFRIMALQAIKCNSVEVLKVLLQEIVQPNGIDAFASLRTGSVNLFAEAVRLSNKHVIKILIDSLLEKGIYLNDVDIWVLGVRAENGGNNSMWKAIKNQ